MKYCPQCGAPIYTDSAQFCPSCGAQVPAAPIAPAQQQQEQQWGGSQQAASEAMLFTGGMSRAEMKQAAKDRLAGNWGKAIGVTLLVIVIIGAASSLSMGIGALLLFGVLGFGQMRFFMQLFKLREVEFVTRFKGFDDFGKTCWLGILQSLLLFAWSLLFAIPGIVKAYAYSMSYYILNDHPEMTANEAVTASKEMMKGHKGELFVLDLSFIGWGILSALTCGILELCYVGPYRLATRTAFYEDLKARQAQYQQAA